MADTNATPSSAAGHENHWQATATQAGTYEFKTGGTYVDRNIDFVVPAGTATASASQASAGSASMAETGFTKSATATSYYVTQSTTAGSAKGSASVGTAGWIDSVSDQSGTTSIAVSGNGNKLYIPTNTIAGSVVDLTAPSVAVSGAATGMETATSGNYYVEITGTPTNGSVKGKATAGTTTGIIAANATNTSSATTITPDVTGSGDKVYIKEQTLGSSNSGTNVKTITPSTSTQYISATTGYQGTARKWTINPISKATAATYEGGTTTVATDKTITRGDFHVKTAGYSGDANSQKLAPATFANEATTGVTYVDISDTTSAPVLVTKKGLWINKGYVDNLYISLAKLVPDGASAASAIQAGMLNSVSAYDNDGNLVTGNIATKAASDVTASGKTVTVPAGYYASQVTKDVASGSVNSYAIDETSQASVIASVSATTPTSGYYPVSVASLTGTVNRTAGYISGTTSTAADSNGGVVGKIVASTTSKTNGTASASASATHNLASGTYTTTATTGYTYHVDASASASTTAASISASVGYVGAAVNASTSAASDSKSSNVYLLDGVITNNTSGGTSTATITSGKQIKIAKGYYAQDKYYTAQAFTTQAITGSLSSSITSGYVAPTLVTSTTSGVPYVTLTGNGSMTQGNQYNGTANGDTKYMQVYAGTYSIA